MTAGVEGIAESWIVVRLGSDAELEWSVGVDDVYHWAAADIPAFSAPAAPADPHAKANDVFSAKAGISVVQHERRGKFTQFNGRRVKKADAFVADVADEGRHTNGIVVPAEHRRAEMRRAFGGASFVGWRRCRQQTSNRLPHTFLDAAGWLQEFHDRLGIGSALSVLCFMDGPVVRVAKPAWEPVNGDRTVAVQLAEKLNFLGRIA